MNEDSSSARMLEVIEKALSDPARIRREAMSILRCIQEEMGGESHYIHKPPKEDRNSRIRAEYAQDVPVKELCAKYNLGNTRIYKIIGETE